MSKMIYYFGNGTADGDASMREILGGKGANLAEMSKLGINVPCGFTISAQECNKYYKNNSKLSPELILEIDKYIARLEKDSGKQFGSPENPMLVSVRSGSKFSMPGMMDTILNLGINENTVLGLSKKTNNPRFAYDSYRRFLQMYGDVVLGIPKHKFEVIFDEYKYTKGITSDQNISDVELQEIVLEYKKIISNATQSNFVEDVQSQLIAAIEAVFKSWMNDRAKIYRKLNNISDSCGTAVNIQLMVFGNTGNESATGVAFTRNPNSGDKIFYGEYLINAQGEDVVAGVRTPSPLLSSKENNSMQELMPLVFHELSETFSKLEAHYKDMQDVEFTVENNKLWILQTRNGKRSAKAAVKIAVDFVKEGLISKEDAILRIDPNLIDQILHPILDRRKPITIVARGLPASPGAVTGKVVFTAIDAQKYRANGIDSILVRAETSPEDIGGMHAASGILTSKGGMTSHASVVARGMGKCCVVGCSDILINYNTKMIKLPSGTTIKQDDIITIDGSTGEVILGEVDKILSDNFPEFDELMSWVDDIRAIKVRTNAETLPDLKNAIKFGAEGIGLCRTEHMFFQKDRIMAFRHMILSQENNDLSTKKVLDAQKSDFLALFNEIKGLPINIRLLDPPLHEFLPNNDEEINSLAQEYGMDIENVKNSVKNMHEHNPMLGHRGARLGITHPEIFKIQVRAIFEAAIESYNATKIMPQIEIMLPLILDKKELQILVNLIHKTYAEIIPDKTIKYKTGTMIELPRACIMANEIAEIADYFSFGTNDLTQTTLGISRDDASKFLNHYVDNEIIPSDPFKTIDQNGVGELMQIAVDKGRDVKPNLTLSVCGEHGGDPASIAFFATLGVNYVSCSPFRVPTARLACAIAEIKARSCSDNTIILN